MPPVVLVTAPEYRRGQPVFESSREFECVAVAPDEDRLAAAVREAGARFVVVGPTRYAGPLYEAIPRGGLIARFGVGHESVDKARATRGGILCTNTPHVLHQSVAELTLFMIGAAARHVVTEAGATKAGRWAPLEGVELSGRTLAVVGCGEIGRAVARIARAGFGMRVVGYARRAAHARGEAEREGVAFDAIGDDFGEAVRDADFVSLHVPGSPENARFIDRERIEQMPARAWLINTARGAVVDEAALYDALVSRRLAGAALDVFNREPYQPAEGSRDFRALPNALLLPHVGSHTVEANRRMAERALLNVRRAQAGELDRLDLLNPEVLRPAR